MLPEYLVHTYKRYKSDTSRFAAWLEETGEACGIELPSVETNVDGDQPSRKSGKKASKQSSANAAGTSPKYRVPLSRWLVLANHIAKSKQNIKIPDEIAALGLRVIALRKRCLSWFSSLNLASQAKSNETHSYFVSILEDVLRVLGVDLANPKGASGKQKSARDTHAVGLKDIDSRFTVLDLQDTEDVNQWKETTDQQKPSTKAQQEPMYETFDDEESDQEEEQFKEAIFAMFCLLQDLQNIRDFVKQTWIEYKENKIDIMTAAVTTNTAIEIARQSIEEFLEQNAAMVQLMNKKCGSETIIMTVFMLVAGMRGVHEFERGPGDPYSWRLADIAEFCYAKTYTLLESFRAILGPGFVPSYKEGYFGTYEPKADRCKMDERAKFNEDKILLLSILPYFVTLANMKMGIPAEDELTQGVKKMISTKGVPLWVAFAAQVYLDIHHTLRDSIQKGWQDARLHAIRTKKTLTQYFELTSKMDKNPFWQPSNDQIAKGILENIERFFDYDVFGAMLEKKANKKGNEFRFYKWHPLLAGLLTFNLNLSMQEFGVTLVNVWGTVIYPAFLYNAIQQEGLISLDWPDMDHIFEFHGEERIFVGGKPKTIDEARTKLMLVMGVSAQAIAAGKNGRKLPFSLFASNKGPRGLEESTIVAAIFRERYVRNGSADYSFANVSRVLNDLADTGTVADESKSSDQVQHSGRKRLQRRFQKTEKLTPLQLLAALRERLVEEEPRLLFNYFGLHFCGLDILRTIRDELHHKFVQYFGPKYVEQEYHLPTLVSYIFEVARNSATAAKQLRLGDGAGVGSNMVMRSGNLMKTLLEKNGRGEAQCKELKVFCKNKTWMKEQKPKVEREGLLYWFCLEEVINPSRFL